MERPALRRIGNLRLVTSSFPGWPDDPFAVRDRLCASLGQGEAAPYGPVQIWFAHAPDRQQSPSLWPCQVGTAITGMARPGANLLVEDFRNLAGYSRDHLGPLADLAHTWEELRDLANRWKQTLRPYWRVCLGRRRLSDGNLLPVCSVGIFVDV